MVRLCRNYFMFKVHVFKTKELKYTTFLPDLLHTVDDSVESKSVVNISPQNRSNDPNLSYPPAMIR